MSAPAILESDLHGRIVAAVRDAEKPLTFNQLADLVRVKGARKDDDEPFRAALEEAVNAGEVHRWPTRGPSQYFWNVPAEQQAREAILAAAATEALSKPDLSKLAARKLPCFSVSRVEGLVSTLVADKQLQKVRGFAPRSKLLAPAGGEREAYFNAARSFLEKKIRAAGFDPAGFFRENSAPQDKLPVEQFHTAARIIEAVRSLEPVKGVPVSTLRLRNHLPQLSKNEFDAAALELRKKERVFLSQHVDPYNISQEDKDLLIDGQDGTYYVAIAIR